MYHCPVASVIEGTGLLYCFTMLRKLLLYIGIISLIPSVCVGQSHWSLNDRSNLLQPEQGRGWRMQLHTERQTLELVPGAKGTGLRTDGYSTFLSVTGRKAIHRVSGYFALESLPTDTAAFVTVLSEDETHGYGASVDCYGTLLLEVLYAGEYKVIATQEKIKPFQWYYVELDNCGSLTLNGKPAVSYPCYIGCQKAYFGKGPVKRMVGLYDTSLINGIMDEIGVNEETPAQEELQPLLAQTPVLAVPEERFAQDFNRPKYHLIPAANWTNETHGLIYYKGLYHIFNQKNASNINLRKINWGHFSSPDLLHWTEQKPVLAPEQGYDPEGCWSGCAFINDEGVPQIIYTAGSSETGVGTAFPKDDQLIQWEKSNGNPVVACKPEGFTRHDMRDQYAWKESDGWHMVIGFGLEGKDAHGTLLHYRSQDLKKWTYENLLYEGKPQIDQTGIFWEMPVVLKLGDRYILSVNRVPNRGIPARTQYWTGTLKNQKFIPDSEVPRDLEVINRLLSPSVWKLTDESAVAIGIIPDEIYGQQNYRQGWAHMFSMPRIWTLKGDKICQAPHPIMETLRQEALTYDSKSGTRLLTEGSHQVELELTFTYKNQAPFGLNICKSADGKEVSTLLFDPVKQELLVDQTKSSLLPYVPNAIRKDKYALPASGQLTLHLFIDGSVVEGFINGEDGFTTRIFTALENSTQIEWVGDASQVEVSGTIYQLNTAPIKTNF